jgi:hypothetical protein
VSSPNNLSIPGTSINLTDDNGIPGNPNPIKPTYVSGDKNGNGILDKREVWLYTYTRSGNAGLQGNLATVTYVAGTTTYGATDPAWYFGVSDSITVKKATDATTPLSPTTAQEGDGTGPGQQLILPVGTPVTWTYRVTNTGNSPLNTITIADSSGSFAPHFVSGDTNGNGALDPGETWLYTSSGVFSYSVVAGQYLSSATVTGTDAHLSSTKVSSSDPSDHFGENAQLTVVKAVNAVDRLHPTVLEDANYAPGPIVPVNSSVTWSYLVSNTGNVTLDLTGFQDDNGGLTSGFDIVNLVSGDTNNNGMLDPGETWLYLATGSAPLGQYKNTATATAVALGVPGAQPITAGDWAYLLGTAPGIDVQKFANGVSAESPSAPVIYAANGPINYTYTVTATTSTALRNIQLVDDNGNPANPAGYLTPTPVLGADHVHNIGDLNNDGILQNGEFWQYAATSTAPFGLANNVVRASGQAGPSTVWSQDINYHLGVIPSVSIVKAVDALNPFAPTSIEDANTQPAKELLVGTTAVWTYVVRNTSNVPVAITSLTDNNGTVGNPADDFHPSYVSGDTNGNGLLDVTEAWLYTWSTPVQSGAYLNSATVNATYSPTGQTATATDVAGYFGDTGAEGLTVGFWKNHIESWPTSSGVLIYSPTQLVSTIFGPLPAAEANETLIDALNNGGGGVDALLRQALSGLLGTTTQTIAYPLTEAQVIAQVDAALASNNATTVDNLQIQLNNFNNAEANTTPPSTTPSVSIANVNHNEGNTGQTTPFVFTLTLSFGPVAPATIAWATADGTAAVAQGDYTAASGTVSFAVGQTTATVSVPVIGDNLYELNETFSVKLTSPVGLTVATGTGTGTIVNDDAEPTVSVAATQAVAIESPAQLGVYTFTRAGNLAGAVVVNLTWSGTAAAARYTLSAAGGTLNAAGTQLTIPAGGATATVTLTAINDNKLEAPQTAIVTLGGSTLYTVGSPSSATATLYDTSSPTISISPVTLTVAGSTSNKTQTFTVSLSGSSPNTTGVTVMTVNGTAVAGTNFTALTATLSFAPGVTSQTVTVTITGRATGHLNKAFSVVLSAPTGGTLGATTSAVTITGTSAQDAAGIAPPGSSATVLTASRLQAVVAEAERQWEALGVAKSRLAAVKFVITRLPVGQLGYTVGDTVYIDATAAGFGWFTGLGSAAFDARGQAIAGGAAAGHMDLLTVVVHELGHTLGLQDGCACGPFRTLMLTMLPAGQRRSLPASLSPPASRLVHAVRSRVGVRRPRVHTSNKAARRRDQRSARSTTSINSGSRRSAGR